MRIGKLIINYPTSFIVGSVLFNTETKQPETMTDETDFKRSEKKFAELIVEDQITGEQFILRPVQWHYIFKCENKDNFKFFNERINDLNVAIILAKDVFTQGIVDRIIPIADAYGQYVAGQKEIKEPVKKFSDWYFQVSV